MIPVEGRQGPQTSQMVFQRIKLLLKLLYQSFTVRGPLTKGSIHLDLRTLSCHFPVKKDLRPMKGRMVPSGSAGDTKHERHYEGHISFTQRSMNTWGLLPPDSVLGQGPSFEVSVPDKTASCRINTQLSFSKWGFEMLLCTALRSQGDQRKFMRDYFKDATDPCFLLVQNKPIVI